MKLIPIFTPSNLEEGIWSIQLDGKDRSELDLFFDAINDIEWLHNFFELNEADLDTGYYGNITIDQAVLKTLEEAEEVEDTLYDYTEQGFMNGPHQLQHLFKPLNNFEYYISIYQKSKARIKYGWLRIYAIRIAKNCYVVTGGSIKLTRDMKREHLNKELKKLEQTKMFLKDHGIDYPEDLNTYSNE